MEVESIERLRVERIFDAHAILYHMFRDSDMSVQEYDRREKELYSELIPYSRTESSIAKFQSLYEKTLRDVCINGASIDDINQMREGLDHENLHALATLKWAEQEGIELEMEYGLRVCHTQYPWEKTYSLIPYLEYPGIAEKLNYDKEKFLDFFDFLFANSDSSPIDKKIYG